MINCTYRPLISVLFLVLSGDPPSLTEGLKLPQLLAMIDSHLSQEVAVTEEETETETSGGTGTDQVIVTVENREVTMEAGGAIRAGMLLCPAGLREAILPTKAAIGASSGMSRCRLFTNCRAWQSAAKCRHRGRRHRNQLYSLSTSFS